MPSLIDYSGRGRCGQDGRLSFYAAPVARAPSALAAPAREVPGAGEIDGLFLDHCRLEQCSVPQSAESLFVTHFTSCRVGVPPCIGGPKGVGWHLMK